MRRSENCEARGFAAFRCAWRVGGAPRTRGRSGFDGVPGIFPSGFALKEKKDHLTASRHAHSRLGRCGKPPGLVSLSAARKTKLGQHSYLRAAKLGCWCTTELRRAAGTADPIFVAVHAFAALRESLSNSTQISGKSSVSRYALRQRADGVREPRPGLNSPSQAPSAKRGG